MCAGSWSEWYLQSLWALLVLSSQIHKVGTFWGYSTSKSPKTHKKCLVWLFKGTWICQNCMFFICLDIILYKKEPLIFVNITNQNFKKINVQSRTLWTVTHLSLDSITLVTICLCNIWTLLFVSTSHWCSAEHFVMIKLLFLFFDSQRALLHQKLIQTNFS